MTLPLEQALTFSEEIIRLTSQGLKEFEGSQGSMLTGESVVILGETGVGKSALIHVLSGATLKAIYNPSKGRAFIVADPPLPGIAIGQEVTSETSIPHKWIDSKGVQFWDCPGWEDNRSLAQEVANAILIQQVFRRSKKVKVLFVVNDASFMDSRAKTLLPLIDTLSELFAENISDIQHSISLVVSHADPIRTEDHIVHCISNIYHDLPTLSDTTRALLQVLQTQPISIFRRPSFPKSVTEYFMDTTLLQQDILAKVERVSYTAGIKASTNLSSSCKILLQNSHNALVSNLRNKQLEFLTSFEKSLTDFVAPYRNESLNHAQRLEAHTVLGSIYVQFNKIDSLTDVDTLLMHCITIAGICGVSLYTDEFTYALSHLKTIEELEKFISSHTQVLVDLCATFQERLGDCKLTIEKIKAHLTTMDENEKAREAAERARQAVEQAEKDRKAAEEAKILAGLRGNNLAVAKALLAHPHTRHIIVSKF